MKIFVLPKTGIQQSEKYALEQIERRLPKDWRGFASLEIVEKSRLGRELDLVLLLPDRVLIVELKRWTGQIKSENGYWFLKGLGKDTFDRRGPSPIKVNNDKAKLLKTLLERNIAGGYAILVDSRIVLCGKSPSPLLPEEEKPYVLQLATFLELGDNNVYKRLLPLPDEFKSRQRASVNPLDKVNEFDLLFRRSPHIRAREFSWNNYKVEGTEIFKHPAGLYREYKAINRDDANAHALLRRWDFSLLGTAASTQNDWVNLAHRESRVFSFVKSKTDELDGVLLQPIGTLASDEVTVDYCELFDLPKKQKRLSDFMETYRGKLPIADRISLVKILVSKFAVLHRVGVAHRDIGDHCIWLDRPHSIRLSGFLTAHFPQMGTIGAIKEQVSSISAKLPEDFFIDKFATSFHRDVFLLGVVAHLLIFEKPPLTDNDKLPQWVDVRNDPISGKLDTWFQRTLSWDTADRWENAEQMLDALNDIPLSPEHTVISLSSFDYFQANTRLRDYEELEEPVENGNQEVFKGMREEVVCLIKVWYGMRPDMSKPSLNHSLLRFLEKARAIQFNPSQWLPRVIDVGLFNKGMLFAREWLDFPTLKEWHEIEHSMEERLNLSLDLLNGLDRLHSIHLQHGDIHPGNLLVRPAGEGREVPSIVFIDSPDFKDGTEQLVTTRYAPANYDRISIDERDRYAAVLVICEILYATYQQPDRGLFSIPSVYLELEHCLASQPSILTLAPLKSAIETALIPPLLEAKPIVVSLARPLAGVAMGPMLSDNGRYYIEPSQKDGEHDRLHVSGPGLQLRLIVNKETRKAQYMDLEKLTHTNFQRKILKAIPFEGKIVLQTGEGNEAEDLINALYENAQVFQKLTKDSLFEDEVEAAEESDTEARKERTAIDTRAIWRRLIDAEIDALPEIKVVKPPRKHPTRKDVLLVPYECKVTLEYAPDDEVELFLQTDSGEQRRVGLLDHRASNLDELVVIQRGFSSKTPPGTQFTLQSKRERQSYERRHDAIDRILAGRSVIPDLVNCFERTAAPEKVLRFPVPSRADFTEYDLYDDSGRKIFTLNDDQKDAFQKLISSGPLCLLQGPPGTGKTLFIGAFLHYLVSQLGVRNVLLVSQSHEATNNALEGTLQLAARTGLSLDVVRVGEDGMLSEAIRHVGVSALQESFRERFRSEFKNRVMALSGRLALNINFVEDYCYLMVHLQPLSDDIDVFESNLQLTTDEGDQAALKQKIAARTNTVMQLASTITEVGEWISIRDVIQRVEQALMEKHNVVNPSAVEKLSQLIRISHEWVDVLRSGSGNFEEFLAKTRTIVAGTCVGVGRWNLGVATNMYDWVIVDEAARATPSELAVSMQVGRRILLVGDHFQLPPFYHDQLRRELSRQLGVSTQSDVFDSDFERAFESPYGKAVGASLSTQYRMSPAICSLVSKCFYEPRGKHLKQGRGGPKVYFDKLSDELRSEVTWVDTTSSDDAAYEDDLSSSRSIRNSFEARTIVDVLRRLLCSQDFVNSLIEDLKPGEVPIGIIAMYSSQVLQIERAVARAEWLGSLRALIKVGTVDGYQGKENRIVIVSLVRNNSRLKQGFLSSPNRLNVAFSRAMDRLIIVGATYMWRIANKDSPLARVVQHFEANLAPKQIEMIDAKKFRA